MFSGQFKMTRKELHGLGRFPVFTVLFFLKTWAPATEGVLAPAFYLALIQQLTAWRREVAEGAGKLAARLWYLSEELIGLSLFNDTVPHGMEARILHKMREKGLESAPKRLFFSVLFKIRHWKTLYP